MTKRFSVSVYLRVGPDRETILSRVTCGILRVPARFRLPAALAAALALFAPLAALAQGNTVRPRVVDRVNTGQLTTLKGNTHPLARAQYDQGAAPADLPMNRIMLVLKRGADQEVALQNLLEQQQVTASPSYHKWLTPDQFGQQFGPADADIQAVTSWLASYGFQGIKVSRGRTIVEFSGTASQVATALHTPIRRYLVNGESHWANAADPQIPTALAPVISGFVSLHNFPKHPASVRLGQKAGTTRTSSGRPQITFTDGSHGIAPADFNTIYNIAPTMTGSGATIGVVARSNIIAQDVADFRNFFGLAANPPQIILNGPDPGDLGMSEEAEAVLDATWPGAVAPAATVDLVVSESTNAAAGEDLSEFYIIDNNIADVMTESFSVCEAVFGTSLSSAASFYSGMAEEAAAQGITYVVASGDSGPDDCDDPTTLPTRPSAPSVNLLASTPFTVAVGGTQFDDTASPSTYWQASNGMNSESAISYIPEDAWNESCSVAQCGLSLSGLWSSGGGASSYFLTPPWQSGVTGIPTTGARYVPDVSLAAANHDGYVLCLDASCQGTDCPPPGAGPCFSILSGTSASAQAFGGIMALVVQKTGARVGIANYALYKLAAAGPPTTPASSSVCDGSVATPLPASTCIFNDVTAGNTNLTVVGENGFAAGTGYDQATGLGSVNVANLVTNWSSAIVDGSSTTLTINSTQPFTFAYGQPVTVTISVAAVAPATGTPTGDVSLIAQNIPGAANPSLGVDCNILPNTPVAQGGTGCLNITNGNFTFIGSNSVSWSTPYLPGGTYPLIAHYAGDGAFVGSDSAPVTVTVRPTTSLTKLAIVTNRSSCTTGTSVAYGSGYVLTVAVVDSASISSPAGSGTVCAPTPSGALPTGTVHITDNGVSLDGVGGSGNFTLNSFGYFEDQQIQLAAGTHNIQAAYSGDNSFNASMTNAPSITVTKAPTADTVTPSSASVAANASFSLTVTVDTQSAGNSAAGSTGAAPTGTVTFTATTAAAAAPDFVGRDWPKSSPFIFAEVCATMACLLALLFASRGRRSTLLLGMALLIVVAVGTSCGSSSAPAPSTVTLGTATLGGATDANGFAAATATLNNVKLGATGTITATYGGDGNYNASTSPAVTVTVQ